MNNHYNKNLSEFAHELRTESVSRAEKYLWKAISANKLGVKFKRQRPMHRFIVDFMSQELGLIVEIDGSSHFAKAGYDAYRQRKLEELGFTVVRFTEGEVMQDLSTVLDKLIHAIHCLRSR